MDTNLDQVVEYIRKSIVPVSEGRKCVDGRYLPKQARGRIARPGGDCGYVMAFMAVNRRKKLGFSAEECLSIVYKSVIALSGKFFMHTDHNCDPNSYTHHGLIGCGHLSKAASRVGSKKYDVSSEDVVALVHYTRFLSHVSSDIEMVNLEGEHMEKGVLVIRSFEYTVLADNPLLEKMYFIYDQDRDLDFMRKLVRRMKIRGLTFADMKKESDLQLNQTLLDIASTLPVYEVRFMENKRPKVEYISTVPQSVYPTRFSILHKIPHFFPQKLSLKLSKN